MLSGCAVAVVCGTVDAARGRVAVRRAFMAIFEPLCGPSVQRPILMDGSAKVGQKRGRESVEDENMEITAPKKKIRLGLPATQWITVYNAHRPMKQRCVVALHPTAGFCSAVELRLQFWPKGDPARMGRPMLLLFQLRCVAWQVPLQRGEHTGGAACGEGQRRWPLHQQRCLLSGAVGAHHGRRHRLHRAGGAERAVLRTCRDQTLVSVSLEPAC
jgi:hypothetical protein